MTDNVTDLAAYRSSLSGAIQRTGEAIQRPASDTFQRVSWQQFCRMFDPKPALLDGCPYRAGSFAARAWGEGYLAGFSKGGGNVA